MKKGIIPALALLFLFLMPLVHASIIDDFLQNDLYRAASSFVVFFAFVFFALKKIIFGDERAINTVVSGIIAYFMTGLFSEKLGELASNYEYMKYAYVIFFIFGLFMLARALFWLFGAGEKINRLKWLAGTYFVLWLIYVFGIYTLIPYENFTELIDNSKNEMPLNVVNLINILGVISGIWMIVLMLRWILGLLHPEERKIIWEGFKEKGKAKKEEWKAKRKENEAIAAEEKRKEEESRLAAEVAEKRKHEERRKRLENIERIRKERNRERKEKEDEERLKKLSEKAAEEYKNKN